MIKWENKIRCQYLLSSMGLFLLLSFVGASSGYLFLLPKEKRLASFLSDKRRLKKSDKLSHEEIETMEKLRGFKWVMEEYPEKRAFNISVAAVQEFVDLYGELPKRGGARMEGQEKRLASFLNHQRRLKKSDDLSQEEIEAMEKLRGFKWVVRERQENPKRRDFDDSVAAVQEFVNTFGELPKQGGTRMEGQAKRLASFLGHQGWLKKSEELSQAEIDAMERIDGFEWVVRVRS